VCDEDTKCFIYELARSLTADHDDDANAEKNTGGDRNVMNEEKGLFVDVLFGRVKLML